MKSQKSRVLAAVGVACLSLGFISVADAAHAASPTSYYVSTSGSDTNTGSLAAPFKTISKCAAVAVAGDSCLMEAGVYHETVTPISSGTASAPITFAPYNGANVTIDGADAVTGWTQYSGNIYVANVVLPTSTYNATGFFANQVFIGGKMSYEASFPAPSGDLMKPNYATAGSGTGWGQIDDTHLPTGVDLTGAVVNESPGGSWTTETGIVTSYVAGQSASFAATAHYQTDCSINCAGVGTSYYITGSLGLLTAANEWYYDGTAHQLYLWAPGNVNPATISVEAKQRNYAFNLAGLSYINVTGLNINASTVYMSPSSSNNVLNGINAQYVSHFLTQVDGPDPTADAATTDCGIYCSHASDSGIILDGANETLENSTIAYSAGNGVALLGQNALISNNTIHDTDYEGGYEAGVRFGGLGSGSVLHNSMYRSGREEVNGNISPYYADTLDSRVAYNDIHDYAYLETDDAGIYFCCENIDGTGSRIDHNWVHDGHAKNGNSNGIYVDNSAHNFQVDHNVVWNTPNNGIVSNGIGGDGTSANNLILNNTIGANVSVAINNNSTSSNGTTIENNLLANGKTGVKVTGTGQTVSNNAAPTNASTFVNPSFEDYRLLAGSSAIDAGVTIPGVTDDYTGTAPDLGAYEFNAAAASTDWTAGSTQVSAIPRHGISNTFTGLNLEIPGLNASQGTAADQWAWNGGLNQLWTFSPVGNNQYSVANLNTRLLLEIRANSTSPGALADQWTSNGGGNQLWTITPNGAKYTITNALSGLSLEDVGTSSGNGAAVDQGSPAATNQQLWSIS